MSQKRAFKMELIGILANSLKQGSQKPEVLKNPQASGAQPEPDAIIIFSSEKHAERLKLKCLSTKCYFWVLYKPTTKSCSRVAISVKSVPISEKPKQDPAAGRAEEHPGPCPGATAQLLSRPHLP